MLVTNCNNANCASSLGTDCWSIILCIATIQKRLAVLRLDFFGN